MQVSGLVDARRFPSVAQFLERQVEMQFADLRVLLQLPLGNFKAGCNFAACAVLLNLLSGFSVCLFDASVEALASQKGRGRRFKDLLVQTYPWNAEPWPSRECSKWLYEMARNPLAHSLGIQVTTVPEWNGIAKRPLTVGEVATLETSDQRPSWLGPTLFQRPVNGDIGTFLSIPGLYWGTWRVLGKLCTDSDQMTGAERLLSKLGYGAA